MSTITTSLARLARLASLARHRRAITVPLLVASALAAGCGTVHGTTAGGATGRDGASTTASAGASAQATPSQPTPVPTVTGGAVAAGQPACVGWPAHAAHATMPALFVPVAAERCVTSIQTIAGKGQWQVATLEKASSDLTALIAALRHAPITRTPGAVCPDLAMVPPQIVVIGASGQELIPLLPVSGCGLVQSAVIAAIDALPWQPVSVHLVAPLASKIPAATTRQPANSPKTLQTISDQPGVLPQ